MKKLSIMLVLGLVSCCLAQPNHECRKNDKDSPRYEKRNDGDCADCETRQSEQNGDRMGFGRSQGFGPQRGGDQRMGFGPRHNGFNRPGFGRQQGFGPQRDGERRMGFGPHRNGDRMGFGHPQGFGPRDNSQGCVCPHCGKSCDGAI